MTLQLILWIFCLHYVSPFIHPFKKNINSRNVNDIQLKERNTQSHIISFSNKLNERSLFKNILEEFMTVTIKPRSICSTMKILKHNHASVPHSYDCTNGFKLGSTCLFHCNEFFKPENSDGDRLSTCMEDGSWIPSIPKCIPVRACPAPDFPPGLYFIYDCNKLTGSLCRVQCAEGLILYGSPKLICQDTGLWTKIPNCGCPVSNFSKLVDFEGKCLPYVDETCGIRCKDGFAIDGPSYIKCQNNGLWSSIPKCVRTCNSPELRGGLSLIGKCVPKAGNTCQLFCKETILVGPNNITCLEDGSWSKMPYCIKKSTCCSNSNLVAIEITNTCPELVSPNLNFQNCSKEVNSSCIVTCNHNKILIGPSKITCLPNSTWSKKPYCTENISLGKSIVLRTNTDVTAAIIEKTKKDIDNEELKITITSQQRIEKCGRSTIPDNIVFKSPTCQKSKLICEVGCKISLYNPTLIMVSVQEAHCDKNGVWNNFPRCLTVKYKYWKAKILEYLCPEPILSDNMKLQSSCFRFPNSKCMVSCINGAILYGSNIITCSNKKWSPMPNCMFPLSEFKSILSPNNIRTEQSTECTLLPESETSADETIAFKEKAIIDQIDHDVESIEKSFKKVTSIKNSLISKLKISSTEFPFAKSIAVLNKKQKRVPNSAFYITSAMISSELKMISTENVLILTKKDSPVAAAENSPIFIEQNSSILTAENSPILIAQDSSVSIAENSADRFNKCKQVKLPDNIRFIPSNCPNSNIKCNVSCIALENQKRIILIQEIFCDEFGTWKNVPNCSALTYTKSEEFNNACPIPNLPDSLEISKDCSYSNNEECTVFCKGGMILHGSNKIICRQGIWSTFPECIDEHPVELEQNYPSSCEETKVPENTVFIPTNCKSIINAKCKAGCSFIDDKGSKVLISVQNVSCKNKTWEGLPDCISVEQNYTKFIKLSKNCAPLKLPSYLQVGVDAKCDPLSMCTVSCKMGMVLHGSKEIICQDGLWSTLPTCKSPSLKAEEPKQDSERSNRIQRDSNSVPLTFKLKIIDRTIPKNYYDNNVIKV